MGEAGKRESQAMREAVRFYHAPRRYDQYVACQEARREHTRCVNSNETPSETIVSATSVGSAAGTGAASPFTSNARPVIRRSSATLDLSPAPPTEIHLASGVVERADATEKRVEHWTMAVTCVVDGRLLPGEITSGL